MVVTHSGITDAAVIKLAEDKAAVLITEDKDFGELVFAHQMATVTVVFLRYRLAEIPVVARHLTRVVREYGALNRRCFIVITSTRIRVRTI